ncbi:MAG TPA: 8-oxoguanine deaminase [Steroidobacteraceae bacterium]|nr:8-oxoguanine deaminase [Steroidobacteraceae bacterium]
MKSLLIRNIHTLVTMNAAGEEIRGAAMLVRGNRIEALGPTGSVPAGDADEVLDLKGRHIVLPGLVNTHHHFYQHLTRAVPAAQDRELFGWLKTLYPIWARMTPEGVRASAKLCAAELILSGCTTASDHLYLFPNGSRLDDEIEAVAATGLRFHASRGSMSVGESQGGLPPDSVVEPESQILKDSERVIAAFHDPEPLSMLRIALAPCSPFSVSQDLMRESAALARSHRGVRLHTHLAENQRDLDYSREHFGQTPVEFAEAVNWLGSDVWHAHCVWLEEPGIARFAETGTGVAHCPCSNMRLASGLAPVVQMRAAGVAVGLGADGAASNDASNLLHEARQAMFSARVRALDAAAMTAREALQLATLGGARVLGREDIGSLAPGMAADFIAVNIDTPQLAGALHDPVAGLVFCGEDRVDYSFINGRCVVKERRFLPFDLAPVTAEVNRLSHAMING